MWQARGGLVAPTFQSKDHFPADGEDGHHEFGRREIRRQTDQLQGLGRKRTQEFRELLQPRIQSGLVGALLVQMGGVCLNGGRHPFILVAEFIPAGKIHNSLPTVVYGNIL